MGSHYFFFFFRSSTSEKRRLILSGKGKAQVGWCSTGIADVAKGTGSLVKANQARTHTHTHTRTADSETKQFLFEPRCWNSLACVPALFRFLSCPDPYPLHTSFPLILQPRFLSPLAPAIELYIYIYIYTLEFLRSRARKREFSSR